MKKTKYVIKCPECMSIVKYEELSALEYDVEMENISQACTTCNGKGTLPVFEEEE